MAINPRVFGPKENNYAFQGHESQPDFGLRRIGTPSGRCINPTTGRFDMVDALSTDQPAWTVYRMMFNNPVNVTDPTGNAEFTGDLVFSNGFRDINLNAATSGVDLSGVYGSSWVPNSRGDLVSEEGDNAYSLAQYLGISFIEAEQMIKQQGLNLESLIGPSPNVREEQVLELDNPLTQALADASDDGKINGVASNCHGCSLTGSTGGVVQGVILPADMDVNLINNYEAVSSGDAKFGQTIIRFGGANFYDRTGNQNVNNHTVIYYGSSRNGTRYVFSKPGFAKRPEIIPLNAVSSGANNYGRIQGAIYGQSG